MLRALLLSLLLSAPSGAAAAARSDDPPVKVWLNQDNFRRGDRARVNAALAEDGYLVVLRADADGRVRVLFPLDPGDDDFVRGRQTIEIRGRGDREAFTIDEREGTGVVLAGRSAAPLRFDEFVSGDHWDYRVLDARLAGSDKEAALLDIVQRMVGDGHFDYDAVTYTVASPIAYHGRPCFGCGSPYYYDGWPYRLHLGVGVGFGSCFDPFFCRSLFFDPFLHPFFFDPFLFDPFFFSPVAFRAIIVSRPVIIIVSRPFIIVRPFIVSRPFIFRRGVGVFAGGNRFATRARSGLRDPLILMNRATVRGLAPQVRIPPGALLNRAASVPASRSTSARVREAASLPPAARARAAVPTPAPAAMGMRRMPEVRGRGQVRWEWSGVSRARSSALPSRGFTLGNRGGRHRR